MLGSCDSDGIVAVLTGPPAHTVDGVINRQSMNKWQMFNNHVIIGGSRDGMSDHSCNGDGSRTTTPVV